MFYKDYGEDNSAADSERNKKERKTGCELIQGMGRNGVWRFPVGSGRQGRRPPRLRD